MMLGVEVTGRGPDMVLLHGWGANRAIWSELGGELSSRFRVHAVDLPGYGASEPCQPYTLERMAAILAAQMPRSCVVCGWSLGGQLALAWAAAAPRQVAKIALIATTPCFVQQNDWTHAISAAVLNGFSRELATDPIGTIRRFISLQALGDIAAQRVAARLRQVVFSGRIPEARVLELGLRLLRETDLREHLTAIAQPTLVLHGERDRVTPLAAGEYLSKAIAKAHLVSVRSAGHAPFVINAGAVRGVLCDFLDGTRKRTTQMRHVDGNRMTPSSGSTPAKS